jgi:ABC-type lipoprotein export system ATPase subunit
MSLQCKNAQKRYGSESGYVALREADITLSPGEFVAVIGRSGSGKSTLLGLLGALTAPSAGQVTIDGKDVWSYSESELADFRAREIGFIFQFLSLLPNLRAIDNVALPALLSGQMETKLAYARAMGLLAEVGLAERANSFPGELSGGEQRRVAIARALINSPRYLLADEPTSDLDEETEADIIDLLDRLRKTESMGLLIVAHDLRIAARADHTYEVHEGVLEATELALPAAPPNGERNRFKSVSLDISGDFEARASLIAPMGSAFWPVAERLISIATVLFLAVMLAGYGVGRYQQMKLEEAGRKHSALETLALSSLRSDVQSVREFGDGRYELTLYLWNVRGEKPIFVMSSGVQAYVQVGLVWQELKLKPEDAVANSVLEIVGKQPYRYSFEANPAKYTELLPHYMHVRFVNNMLVSPESSPRDDLFERKDNYYVYLKPWNVDDKVILKDVKFDGAPPVWIPMPPH